MTDIAVDAAKAPRSFIGLTGFAFGAGALILVLIHFWAGPFAPQKDVSVTVGEIAAEIRQAATRAITGEPQPEPKAEPWDIDRILEILAASLAGLAIVLGVMGLIRRESLRPAIGAISLGASAVAVQLFIWSLLLIAGCILLYGIIQNIDGIFDGLGG